MDSTRERNARRRRQRARKAAAMSFFAYRNALASNDMAIWEAVVRPRGSNRQGCTPKEDLKPSLTIILDLPYEMLFNIFLYLDHESIANCAMVCTTFNKLSKDVGLFPKDLEIIYSNGIPEIKYVEWLINRSNPREFYYSVSGSPDLIDLIPNKLNTWHDLEELYFDGSNLRHLGDISMNNLKGLVLSNCSINCETVEKLLRQSKAIRHVKFEFNTCLCDKACNIGVLPFIDIQACNDNVKKVCIQSVSGTCLQDLNRLSVCTSITYLLLEEKSNRGPNMQEETLAMEMIARNCIKLEKVTFINLPYVTDKVLEALIENCTDLKELLLSDLANITETSCTKAIYVLPQLESFFIAHCILVSESSAVRLRDAIKRSKSYLPTRMPPELYYVN